MKKPPELPEVRRNSDGMLMSTREEVDARVAFIEDKMVRGEFKRGETVRELSKEWGIDLKTVQRYASLASRLAWDDSDDSREELKAQSITKLLAIADEAHTDGKFKDATGAIKVANEVAGVLRPGPAVAVQNNIQVNGASPPPTWFVNATRGASPEDLNLAQFLLAGGGDKGCFDECKHAVLETVELASKRWCSG